jgi:hypothetical protein
LHHFGYHRGGAAEPTPLFDFNVYPTADGSLAAHVYDADAMMNLEQANPSRSPSGVGSLRDLYRKAADATGRITVWQDGVQILDLANL